MKNLLVANRGEIARRIIRTARRLGLRTVAVYSKADAGALHMREADQAILVGEAAARDSYLDGARLIAAARQSGADAVHPGYGFLSENADFAQDVMAAGLVWVGPPPEAIRAMGRKDAAKRLMQAACVPTTPGYNGEDQTPERLSQEAGAIGYPVLIKAVAGGGGKGMRKVESADDFEAALAACRREALAAFGDAHVLIEKYISSPRHIEVQVFGDQQGNIIHLFERDCSIQRRHQKVIEEAPAPGMDEATRQALCAAAVQAARAVNYVGAGTVEFIADAADGLRADRIWFMEMNTRLQVEHAVTEQVTGLDLVEWQLRVAAGEALPLQQHEVAINGHAIEARLCAEDPARDFMPSTGRLELFRLPDTGLRVETGVCEGDQITPFYDPMIAKLIAHAPARQQAAAVLAAAVAGVDVWPVRTNAGLLARILSHPDFQAGDIDTGFLERHAAELLPGAGPPDKVVNAAAQAVFSACAPAMAAGFRLNRAPERAVRVQIDGQSHTVVLPCPAAARDLSCRVYPYGEGFIICADGLGFHAGQERTEGRGGSMAADGAVLAPLPGRLIAVLVVAGDQVSAGQALLVLEAMKMEYTLKTPFDGRVDEVHAVVGAQVSEGAGLMRISRANS